MRRMRGAVGMTVLMTGLTGCYKSTRTVQKALPPAAYQTVPVEALEAQLTQRDEALKTLRASVMITASTGGAKEGKVTEYTSLKGYIFLEQPAKLRVILQVPVLGSRALDMVSENGRFLLVHAQVSGPDVWMQGTNHVTVPDKNPLRNLRPPVFLDSLLVDGIHEGEFVTLTDSTRILQPETKHRDAIAEPVYELTVLRVKNGNVMTKERVVRISRVTLLPYEQEIYDAKGEVATLAQYSKYQAVNGVEMPMLIQITRPQDELGLKIEIDKLTLNEVFEADQFELKPPVGVTVQKLE